MKNINLQKLLAQHPDDLEIGTMIPKWNRNDQKYYNIMYYKENIELLEIKNDVEETLYIMLKDN